ncbi:hypothetical protein BIFBRE_05113 [Bifidobacterium breve DSM 20213 = JCM 1192]|uniref:Uncharacterized protein n=2 Tax=Bifidobacterium breve TaxID=1685 RepID=D4BSM1_BIFBR|nr:hypothetical protein BIFBRE_05113 [Bifidobacterium breve DSM 20213 = JCM 1192]
MWTQQDIPADRTNNKVEGFHSDLNNGRKSHPELKRFITLLIEDQKVRDLTSIGIEGGEPSTTRRRKKYVQSELKLKHEQERYKNGLLGPFEFLEMAASLLAAK